MVVIAIVFVLFFVDGYGIGRETLCGGGRRDAPLPPALPVV